VSIRIAHISDLHLGDDLVVRSLLDRRWYKNTEDSELFRNLSASLQDLKPDYLVITGDIVNKCDRQSFEHAAKKIQRLVSEAGLEIQTRLLVIPGNHDVKIFPDETQYFGRIQPFVEFLKDLFDEDNYRTRTERFLRVDVKRRLCFLCLDTSLRDKLAAAEGRIGEPQWRWAKRKMEELAATHADFRTFLKIAVLHHHPYPLAGGGSDKWMPLDDAGECQRFLEAHGFQVVLHGHKHYPRVDRKVFDNGNHVTVVSAGTACCPIPSENRAGNSFYFLECEPSTNLLRVTKILANQSKVFESGEVKNLPLFTPSERGYKMREYVNQVLITNGDGNCEILDRRIGLVADSEKGTGVNRIHFFLTGLPDAASIDTYESQGRAVTGIEYETPVANRHRERKGHFILASPLSWGDGSIDFDIRTEISRGFQMRRTDTQDSEAMSIENMHPTDELNLTMVFPPGFTVSPEPEFRDPLRRDPVLPDKVNHSVERDPFGNRFTLRVKAPQLGHVYGFKWPLP
jgi:3',5'-cyclic AMP phosphodiesterase CpdA